MNLFKNPEKYRKQILITSVVLVVIAAAVVLAGVAARFGNASVHLPDNVSSVNTDESIGVYTEDVSSVKTNAEVSDVEIEVNGIMTYDREVIKVDEKRFAEINRSVIESLK